MDDRTLLELAAKAAGIDYHIDTLDGCQKLVSEGQIWNPLFCDGQALQLIVKLFMSVDVDAHEESTYAYAGTTPRTYAWENWRNDPAAATRRAIVRAAAQIALDRSPVSAPGAVEGEKT